MTGTAYPSWLLPFSIVMIVAICLVAIAIITVLTRRE